MDYAWQLITPIICEGDIIGSVILLENDGKSKMGEVEQKLALSAALPGQTDGTIIFSKNEASMLIFS